MSKVNGGAVPVMLNGCHHVGLNCVCAGIVVGFLDDARCGGVTGFLLNWR